MHPSTTLTVYRSAAFDPAQDVVIDLPTSGHGERTEREPHRRPVEMPLWRDVDPVPAPAGPHRRRRAVVWTVVAVLCGAIVATALALVLQARRTEPHAFQEFNAVVVGARTSGAATPGPVAPTGAATLPADVAALEVRSPPASAPVAIAVPAPIATAVPPPQARANASGATAPGGRTRAGAAASRSPGTPAPAPEASDDQFMLSNPSLTGSTLYGDLGEPASSSVAAVTPTTRTAPSATAAPAPSMRAADRPAATTAPAVTPTAAALPAAATPAPAAAPVPVPRWATLAPRQVDRPRLRLDW